MKLCETAPSGNFMVSTTIQSTLMYEGSFQPPAQIPTGFQPNLTANHYQVPCTSSYPNQTQQQEPSFPVTQHQFPSVVRPKSSFSVVKRYAASSLDSMINSSVMLNNSSQWDINDPKLPKVVNFDQFSLWPQGSCCFAYNKANSEQARRHVSGWAMRNTNNHNTQILKKSCLGVLLCSNSNCDLAMRPAICDKARHRQEGKQCPKSNCNGTIYMRRCRGHEGYPVTHFWREVGSTVYFQAKGTHDHIRPDLKPVRDTAARRRREAAAESNPSPSSPKKVAGKKRGARPTESLKLEKSPEKQPRMSPTSYQSNDNYYSYYQQQPVNQFSNQFTYENYYDYAAHAYAQQKVTNEASFLQAIQSPSATERSSLLTASTGTQNASWSTPSPPTQNTSSFENNISALLNNVGASSTTLVRDHSLKTPPPENSSTYFPSHSYEMSSSTPVQEYQAAFQRYSGGNVPSNVLPFYFNSSGENSTNSSGRSSLN
ncbi:Glial cells missing [Cichlidogyrus casuarinus]|uniref:Glial cells missing n=1 Tax=Cichlidogyrus casuarinus TaxID=1844966 RepID=A0ABD2QBX2_9PLAT